VIPFATAFIGDYPLIPLVVALYGLVLFMAALAFTLMLRYVFFRSALLPESVTPKTRKEELRHALIGVIVYGVSMGVALVYPVLAIIIFIIVPLYYFLPHRIEWGGRD